MGESVAAPRPLSLLSSVLSQRSGRAGALLTLAMLAGALVIGSLGARHVVVFPAVVAAAVVAGLCVFAYVRPAQAIGVAFFLLLIAQTKFRRRPPTASASGELDAQVALELGLFAAIAAIAVFAASSKAFRARRPTTTELLLGAYVALALVSALWSLTPRVTVVKSVQIAILYALGLTAVRVLGPEGTLRTLARAVVPYVVVFALIALAIPGTRSLAIQPTHLQRFSWFYLHPIGAAMYTGAAILAVYTAYGYRSRSRDAGATLRAVSVLFFLTVVLAMTRTRGPVLAVLAGVGALIVRSRAPRWLVASVAATVLLVAAVYANAGASFIDWIGANSHNPVIGFLLRDQTAGDIAEFSGREELWKAAGGLFAARPILGYGYGGARLLLLDAAPWAGDAHNALMQSVLDVGALGSLPLLGAIGAGLFAAVRGPRYAAPSRPPYVQAATLAYLLFALVNATTDVCFAEPGLLFLIVATCVPAAERLRAVPEGVLIA